ncbi:MAG: twin-arginine translocation pathway signal protein, partial [Gemmatimonas sp.]
MERRAFIRVVGGGVVLAAGASALTGCVSVHVPRTAVTAWAGPTPDSDLRRWALSFAILAPNPHNLQPWLADLQV